MEEELDMSLVADRFDDCDIDDQPLDVQSEVGSYYDNDASIVEPTRSRNLPTTNDFSNSNRYRPRQRAIDAMSTINEDEDGRSVMESRLSLREKKFNLCDNDDDKYRQGTSDDKKNAFNDSLDYLFQTNGANPIDEFEKEFYNNKANLYFTENDPRCERENLRSEKENSWEPSVYHYEKQPTPEIKKSPEYKETNMIFKKDSIIPGKDKRRAFSPEKSFFSCSPISARYVDNAAKQSTPKRPITSKGISKPSFFNISSISSICPGSPTRSIYSKDVANNSTMSNVTVNKTLITNVIKTTKYSDLMIALELARKNRIELDEKSELKDYSVNRSAATRTALEPTRNQSRINSETARSFRSSSIQCKESNSKEENVFKKPVESLRSENERCLSRASSVRSNDPRRDMSTSVRTCSRASSTSINTATSSKTAKTEISGFPLRFNMTSLGFGAIDIGDSLTLDLVMENISDRTAKVRCNLDSMNKAFEIIDNRLTMIDPGNEAKVRVKFSPEVCGSYQIYLEIRVENMSENLMKMTLWGLGGTSAIAPVVSSELVLSRTNDFVCRTSRFSNLLFKLKNSGVRNGYARIDVYDSFMKPIKCNIYPSNCLMIAHRSEKSIKICTDNYLPEFSRSSSSMSVSSRKSMSGADLIIEIRWGEEMLRQRLKQLEQKMKQDILVDNLDFTQTLFDGENEAKPKVKMATVVRQDKKIFEGSCRTTKILVYSLRNSRRFEYDSDFQMNSINVCDTMVDEPTFRQYTFFRDDDVTMVPRK